MERIATWHDDLVCDLESRISFDFAQVECPRPPARLTTCIPLHYEPRYAYPLLVWLPGGGADEESLAEVMPRISLRNYVGASIGGPLARRGEHSSRSWDLGADGVERATESVQACIQTLRMRLNVAPHRVFLAGHADGGTMAIRIALQNPRLFAGVASFGGALPTGRSPLAALNQLRQLEILLCHGRASESYSEDACCHDLRLLHSAGINVTVRQYPHGEELSERMLNDLNDWAMQLVTGQRNEGITKPFESN